MSSTDAEFYGTVTDIRSARHYQIAAASGAWLLLAQAAQGENTAMGGIAANVEAEPGVGLLQLADRVHGTAGWLEGAGSVAQQIAEQLVRAGMHAAEAQWNAEDVKGRYDELAESHRERMAVTTDSALSTVAAHGEEAKRRLVNEAQGILNDLGSQFAHVIGGDAPAAPGGGGGGGGGGFGASAGGAGGMGAAAAAGFAGGAGAAMAGGGGHYQAANGATVGMGEYPHSRVLGPERGDFAGWVESPTTGFLTDPATGREFDTVTGRWIDPITGRPFGEVTEYASRLSGLGAGPGAVVGITGGAAALGASAGMAGMYGGTMPPSIGNTGPARGQMAGQAARNMSHRAGVASRFAMGEAAQGGRPFMPPPGAQHHGRTAGVAGGRNAGAAGAAGGAAGRTAGAAGARGFVPPPAAAANQAGRAPGKAGARAAATARHQLTNPPPAPGTARAGKDRRSPGKPTEFSEDRNIWDTHQHASRGVLGE